MDATPSNHLAIDRSEPGIWRVAIRNPPINMLAPKTIVELQDLVSAADAHPGAKVVTFESTDPDFFISHFDTARSAEMPTELGPSGHAGWVDFVVRLSRSPVISIAKIRGRTRGVGNEFVLACDMRFASREKAVLGNPEVGVGLSPGGGALQWLPRVVGRSRALEIALSGDDFEAEVAERYGWVNRALSDTDLDAFVDQLARRLSSYERETLREIKAQVSRTSVPEADEFESSQQAFWDALGNPAAKARRAGLGGRGYGERSDFELNFGRYLPELRPQSAANTTPS